MAFMSGYERRFDQLRSTGRLQSAFTRWRERQEFLTSFSDSESLISTFRSRRDEDRLLKHLGLLAICFEAREGDEDAFLLLVGLYLPTFRRLRREIGPCLLEEEDLEAEMIAGGDEDSALEILTAAVEREPLCEDLYRRIIAIHAAADRKSEAEAVYRKLATVLAQELGEEPEPATEELMSEVRKSPRGRPELVKEPL